ncbi:TetR/AcrR family transcriptional regulator [Devosia neptuniae]|uniref:TetR/AcrR family transcriptional regulator n=1 Tax=Devosia TaxID=46913 RepID=UPI0022AEE246|nr:TetR/AcrR family transcriptional regulator [Devosia neptuniae]MCZ4347654.1 TetR/AcrR family transcriptional regulator [Devosia neptuniae]
MSAAADARAAEKRRRTLDAARFLMLRDGLRGTTMEAIARQAGIAKATLYAQYPDKEAVFAGILDELTGALTEAFDAGMAGPGPLPRRIGAAMAGKYGVIAAIVEGSPFAQELFSSHGRISDRLRALDTNTNAQIVDALRAAGVAEPTELSRLVQAACYGVAQKLIDETAVRAGIMMLCERLIAPEIA